MGLSDIKKQFQAVKKLLDPPLGRDARPLDIRASVIDAIERRVEPVGQGRRAFPYNRVLVRLLTPAKGDKAPLEVAFADLDVRVRDRLREVRCDPPDALDFKVAFVKNAPPDWGEDQLFSVEYQSRAHADAGAPPSSSPILRVSVLKGTATKKVYTFRETLILMGRTPEVSDNRGWVRRNHVAFEDANSTVSRAHARLKYHLTRREYRLFDDGSVRGTRVVRGGATIPVPQRDPRGVRIQSGDEIQLGDASVRVTIS